jgi:ABC-type proline/glycine betaine transport system substrate-binding protein
MNKKHSFLFGFTVIAIAAMVTFTGCPTEEDSDGGGKTVTITLAKSGTGFTLTIAGADWDESALDTSLTSTYLDFSGLSVTDINSSVQAAFSTHYEYVRSGKVITATPKSSYSSPTGPLKFKSDEPQIHGATYYTGYTTTFAGAPDAEITF